MSIYDSPMVSSHREMSHILGLKDYLFNPTNEGWYADFALDSIKRRFHNLAASPRQLDYRLLSNTSTAKITKKVKAMTSGDYFGFSADWWSYAPENPGSFRHAYSIHVVKEGHLTHLIYVNRGQPHYDYVTGGNFKLPRVYAFTATTKEGAAALSKELFSAARSFNARERISEFISKHQCNIPLAAKLSKESHKVGNCTIANSNISWHFQLASNYMKSHPGTTLEKAYEATQEQYRQMRLKDRKDAFQYLLQDRLFYLSNRNYLYNYFQVINSLVTKDFKNKNQNNFLGLINDFDQETLQELINPMLSDDFSIHVDEFIDDMILSLKSSGNFDEKFFTEFSEVMRNNLHSARNKLLILAMQKLIQSEQEELIKNDISLLKGAKPELQKKYLSQDFNKYCLYASPEALGRSFDQERVKKYINFTNKIKCIHKTSGNLLLSRGSGKKEAKIDNQFNALVSYLFMDDSEKVAIAFDELCKICGERRFSPFGEKYSSDTDSSQWLIQKLQSDDPIIVELRDKLGLSASNLESKVEEIIAKQNNAPEKMVEFKNRFQAQNGSEKTTQSENILDETTEVKSLVQK